MRLCQPTTIGQSSCLPTFHSGASVAGIVSYIRYIEQQPVQKYNCLELVGNLLGLKKPSRTHLGAMGDSSNFIRLLKSQHFKELLNTQLVWFEMDL